MKTIKEYLDEIKETDPKWTLIGDSINTGHDLIRVVTMAIDSNRGSSTAKRILDAHNKDAATILQLAKIVEKYRGSLQKIKDVSTCQPSWVIASNTLDLAIDEGTLELDFPEEIKSNKPRCNPNVEKKNDF